MTFPSPPISATIAVIGAGTMGAGIALVAARAGHRTLLYDAQSDALSKALTTITSQLEKQCRKGRMDTAGKAAILDRLIPADRIEALAPATVIIEAIVENMEVKSAVLRQVEAVVSPDAIIATNSSSLSITAIGARLARPERFAGMHFFNPAPLLPLVEIVAGRATSPAILDILTSLASFWGKQPIRCASTPGFIVNRIARPFYAEALRLLEERCADSATIDAVQRECGGFRMGPFELMDLIGHDVNFAVTRSVYDGMFQDRRYLPSLTQRELVDAGWLGRKTKRGFYDYEEGAHPPRPQEATPATAPHKVTIMGDLGPASALISLMREAGMDIVDKKEERRKSGEILLDDIRLLLTDGRMATEHSVRSGRPVALFDLALNYAETPRIALAPADGCARLAIDQAVGFFQALGKTVSIIDDAPGLIVARTVAMLVNEAANVLHQGLASAADIDLAMTKGVNYPVGPLAWGNAVGFDYIAGILDSLADIYRDDRYRCSPLLRRHALRSDINNVQEIGAVAGTTI